MSDAALHPSAAIPYAIREGVSHASAAPAEGPFARYFYDSLSRCLALHIQAEDSVIEVNPLGSQFSSRFAKYRAVAIGSPEKSAQESPAAAPPLAAPYVLLGGTIHFERDIHALLSALHGHISPETRVILTHYSTLWKPFMHVASKLGLRTKAPEENWISHEDVANFCLLSGFEIVRSEPKILCPIPIPLLADFINRCLAPLPFFRLFCMVNIVVARALKPDPAPERPSVSVVVPARNEAGNIGDILARCPVMGPRDELIFVEGNSTDDTWKRIRDAIERYRGPLRVVAAQQEGKGKGDAVRKGFSIARNEILMILDADLTVPPEELPKFYDALVQGKGEMINGSRLVYPMEKQAMRFFNVLGNKFFARAFSFVLGQRFKDTLCGTKVLTRKNYERIAAARSYFGEFDPFGDFDLIFGAARLALKIVDLPIRYRERTYGETNIHRWRHGVILLCMVLFAARRIKFLPAPLRRRAK